MSSAGALGLFNAVPSEPASSKKGGVARENYQAQLRRPRGGGDGVGGAELDCSGPHPSARCRAVRPLLESGNEGLFQPMSFSALSRADEGLSVDTIEQLDYLIEVLKTLPIGLPANGHVNPVSDIGSRTSMHEGIDFAMSSGSFVLC